MSLVNRPGCRRQPVEETAPAACGALVHSPVFQIVLVAPEIPQNTGTIGRLCVCAGAHLHLIRPLGFSLSASRVRRAGLDYWPLVPLSVHESWDAFLDTVCPARLVFVSTRGRRSVYACRFQPGDSLVFGNETSGLPPPFYSRYRDALYRIPMPGRHARSHNLANAASIVLYEALRQTRDLARADTQASAGTAR